MCSDLFQQVQVNRPAVAGAINIDHMQAPDTSRFQFLRQLKRVLRILRFLFKIALAKVDKAPAH